MYLKPQRFNTFAALIAPITHSAMAIHLHIEPPLKFVLKERANLKKWLKNVIITEGAQLGNLNFIFCTDDYLLEMNQTYLQHHTLTDVITFDNSEKEGLIEGDIFISVERVQDNALKFGVANHEELRRVMVHGVLHLLGYGDKTPEDKAQMRQKENDYLVTI